MERHDGERIAILNRSARGQSTLNLGRIRRTEAWQRHEAIAEKMPEPLRRIRRSIGFREAICRFAVDRSRLKHEGLQIRLGRSDRRQRDGSRDAEGRDRLHHRSQRRQCGGRGAIQGRLQGRLQLTERGQRTVRADLQIRSIQNRGRVGNVGAIDVSRSQRPSTRQQIARRAHHFGELRPTDVRRGPGGIARGIQPQRLRRGERHVSPRQETGCAAPAPKAGNLPWIPGHESHRAARASGLLSRMSCLSTTAPVVVFTRSTTQRTRSGLPSSFAAHALRNGSARERKVARPIGDRLPEHRERARPPGA